MSIYKGIRLRPELETGSDVKVTVEEGKEETMLRHHIYHSPTGFCWGYGGSGPSDLARSILWDFLGKEPPVELYQAFKWEFVAKWVEKWQISSADIKTWMALKYGKDYINYLTKTDQSDPRD